MQVEVSLDDLFTKSMVETNPQKAMQVAQDLLPAVLLLIESYTVYIRYLMCIYNFYLYMCR